MILKDWGKAYPLFESPTCRVVRVEIEAGWQCSTHWHAQQYNAFYVVSGALEVVVAPDSEAELRRVLRAGSFLEVEPIVTHHFRSLTAVEAIEIYRQADSDSHCWEGDIIRETLGKRIRD